MLLQIVIKNVSCVDKDVTDELFLVSIPGRRRVRWGLYLYLLNLNEMADKHEHRQADKTGR